MSQSFCNLLLIKIFVSLTDPTVGSVSILISLFTCFVKVINMYEAGVALSSSNIVHKLQEFGVIPGEQLASHLIWHSKFFINLMFPERHCV